MAATALPFAVLCLLLIFPKLLCAEPANFTRHYDFHIGLQNLTRLCRTKTVITVNGKFPGPPILAREGDRVVVKVTNHVQNNISLHWHGIRQLQTAWYDGPSYVTQCPIRTGQSFVYNFTIIGQRGTLFWHAHTSWLRSTVYGPLIIYPKIGVPYPFPYPYREVTIFLGEWWNADPEAVVRQALQTGGAPNVSNAYTINGLPGLSYNCSGKDTFRLRVKPGKTYLLRIVNAALNEDLFFRIAGHILRVVEADAMYMKPFDTETILLAPGQTTNVLLNTKTHNPKNATFLMMAGPYSTIPGTFNNLTTTGTLEYINPSSPKFSFDIDETFLIKPTLPPFNDTSLASAISKKHRSLATAEYPCNVPEHVDKEFFMTVSLGTAKCPLNQTCQGPNGTKFAASMNNVSYMQPTTSLLEAYFFGKSKGVYTVDFPTEPPFPFNYTGSSPNNTQVSSGTKAILLPFNCKVQVVLQDTSIIGAESHPIHLHGFNFFVVGEGFGNYDPERDPPNFNLVDPAERNTAGVPTGGWMAIRFRADNPGVWFMHCHLDGHTSWGLDMAWIVMDGELPHQKLLPPPEDLPKC